MIIAMITNRKVRFIMINITKKASVKEAFNAV